MPVASAPECNRECRWHEQLEEGATEETEELAAKSKDEMSGFMDGQIEAVQPAVGVWGPEAEPSIDRENHGENDAPATLQDGIRRWTLHHVAVGYRHVRLI